MKEPNWFQFQYGKDRGELQITRNIQKLLLLNGVIINYAHCWGMDISHVAFFLFFSFENEFNRNCANGKIRKESFKD